MVTIRGATSIQKDCKEEIEINVIELFDEILRSNKIESIEAIIFSVTPDIKAFNPSTIIRTHYNLNKVSFMTLQEAMFEDSLKMIIRILVLCESSTKNFVYLHRAKNLRNR